MNTRIPTVNDLRVKLCYICREEERFGEELEGLPKPWTHPCKCTLVAHESCLLKWIHTSQGDSSRAPNALKCPQCGSEYELESDRPVLLRILAGANKALQKVGRALTLMGIAGVVGIMGSGVYILCTGYGAWALQQFLGKEMYELILTDDPSNWPWTAFLNLPLLPLTLIISRFQSSKQIPSIIPVLLVWPVSSPVGARQQLLNEHWTQPENARKLVLAALPSTRTWPPSPVVFGLFIFPWVRIVYKRCFSRLQYWALGTPPIIPPPGNVVWELNEGGPIVIRIRANIDGQGQQQQPAPEVDFGEQDPNVAAVAAAERLIEIDTSSFGRRVGGALLIPAISSMMGSIMFRLSKRSHVLRGLLGIRRPLNGLLPPPLGAYSYGQNWEGLGILQQLKLTFRLLTGIFLGGTRTWTESDPVWWRNSLGFGLFVVAKDCLQLLHLWLAKREVETRRVKSRDFEGVNFQELDLIPSFPHP